MKKLKLSGKSVVVPILVEEGGITENSVKNAEILFATYERIDHVDFIADKRNNDYFVDVHWSSGQSHRFTGFAWGYGGTGPHYLEKFLEDLYVDQLHYVEDVDPPFTPIEVKEIPMDRYGKTDMTWFIWEKPSGSPKRLE